MILFAKKLGDTTVISTSTLSRGISSFTQFPFITTIDVDLTLLIMDSYLLISLLKGRTVPS